MFKKLAFIVKALGCLILGAVLYFSKANMSNAAVLSVGPTAGTFTVGSTFDVSIYINSEGKSVNAIEASLSFPPDRLQLVSPSTGKSVIGVWTVQPNVNNQTGRIDLQGGIPGGINVSSGLVTTLTFRVKSVGSGIIRFLDNSKILLNDGKGTNDLNNTVSGVYSLVLPPPAGPVVTSETHPDQTRWYNNPNVVLAWADDEKVEGYSFEVNSDPTTIPDDIVDSQKVSVAYRNVGDGIKYFHIKALRAGSWGGTTHFAIKIDTTPPADFSSEVIPSKRTVRRQPIIQFSTTDANSGLDHYELKLIPLSRAKTSADQSLFIEVTSPYIPERLELGDYDVIVRAYDQAGNFRESVMRLSVVTSAFEFVSGTGVQVAANTIIPWVWFLPPFLLLLLVLLYIAYRLRRWHDEVVNKRKDKELPDHVRQQLKELAQYRAKYGKALVVMLLCLIGAFHPFSSRADTDELPPPLITTLSRNISNQDIFYIGGKTDSPSTDVVIHLQNSQTGETTTSQTQSDKKGEWFYRHDSFLPTGKYIIWVQSRLTQQSSPPSPQEQIQVRATAMQFGASRISFELLYLVLIVLLSLVLVGLIMYILYHARHGRKKHKLLKEEIRQAEESVRRGFAVIKRDLESELAIIRKAKLKGELSEQEQQQERQLQADIAQLENRLGQEIWELEQAESN